MTKSAAPRPTQSFAEAHCQTQQRLAGFSHYQLGAMVAECNKIKRETLAETADWIAADLLLHQTLLALGLKGLVAND